MQDFKMAELLCELDELGPEVTGVVATLLCKTSVGEWNGMVTMIALEALHLPADQREWLAELLLAIDHEPSSNPGSRSCSRT